MYSNSINAYCEDSADRFLEDFCPPHTCAPECLSFGTPRFWSAATAVCAQEEPIGEWSIREATGRSQAGVRDHDNDGMIEYVRKHRFGQFPLMYDFCDVWLKHLMLPDIRAFSTRERCIGEGLKLKTSHTTRPAR